MTRDALEDARSVVRAYHDDWTHRRFAAAADRLAPDVRIEVPINEYPSRASFAQALVAFGTMVDRVVVLAEFAHDGEAMLLYDLEARGLGTMRVAEHFTVVDGRITRLRQVHDTAPVRAAGLARGA